MREAGQMKLPGREAGTTRKTHSYVAFGGMR